MTLVALLVDRSLEEISAGMLLAELPAEELVEVISADRVLEWVSIKALVGETSTDEFVV
mgnify:CR=1 FL=1